MKIPYITCPLEAALAAKNHGFRYVYKQIKHVYGESISDFFRHDDYDDICKPVNDKHYIADESLQLLDPVNEDIGIDKEGALCEYYNGWSLVNGLAEEKGYEVTYPVIMIVRNGKLFPKIHWEE